MNIVLKCPHCGAQITANLKPGKHVYAYVCDVCERESLVSVVVNKTQPPVVIGPTEFKDDERA